MTSLFQCTNITVLYTGPFAAAKTLCLSVSGVLHAVKNYLGSIVPRQQKSTRAVQRASHHQASYPLLPLLQELLFPSCEMGQKCSRETGEAEGKQTRAVSYVSHRNYFV